MRRRPNWSPRASQWIRMNLAQFGMHFLALCDALRADLRASIVDTPAALAALCAGRSNLGPPCAVFFNGKLRQEQIAAARNGSKNGRPARVSGSLWRRARRGRRYPLSACSGASGLLVSGIEMIIIQARSLFPTSGCALPADMQANI